MARNMTKITTERRDLSMEKEEKIENDGNGRRERVKGKRVMMTNRQLWVEGRKRRWDEGRSWTEEEKE